MVLRSTFKMVDVLAVSLSSLLEGLPLLLLAMLLATLLLRWHPRAPLLPSMVSCKNCAAAACRGALYFGLGKPLCACRCCSPVGVAFLLPARTWFTR